MEHRSGKFMPALWGGLLSGFIGGVPAVAWLNCFCYSGVMLGGILAVYLYRRELGPEQLVDSADGALLGLTSGALGVLIAAILNMFVATTNLNFVFRMAQNLGSAQLDDWLYRFDPAMLKRLLFFFWFSFNLVVYCLFGLVGGLLGVALFGETRNR